MHAALAYLSPELQTVDSIIRDFFMHQSKPRLPTELFLLIRSHLLPAVTIDLLNMSTLALSQYESSIRGLLCFECLAYNQEIYGQDIWQWGDFSGGCACAGIEKTILNRSKPQDPEWGPLIQPNPKQFTDRSHWLEFYLSYESSHLTGLPLPPENPSLAIWDVVESVLRNYECQVIQHRSLVGLAQGPSLSSSGSNHRQNIVTIIPKVDIDDKTGSISPHEMQFILRRADRDLGLRFEYGNDVNTLPENIHPQSSPCHRGFPFTRFTRISINILQAVARTITVCLALPLIITTLALTVLCYYSRPKSLRII